MFRKLDGNYTVESRYVALCTVKGEPYHAEGYGNTEEEADVLADAWVKKAEREHMGKLNLSTLVIPVMVLVHRGDPSTVLAVLCSSGVSDESRQFLGSLGSILEKTLPIWPTYEAVSSLAKKTASSA